MYGDLAAGFHSFRLFTPRRTTRNVTSAERRESPAARVILTAHHDAGRTGLLYAIPLARAWGAGGAAPRSTSPLALPLLDGDGGARGRDRARWRWTTRAR